ncbi:MAG: aminotransferase class I/II-fold pyridoxal phosphate-dependent enzyme [Helicobacter sp.]|nr:aminotransferase class I/II-fold pyridoxal phosphate-dependent enzyme [Helicobacter sp.]
MKQIDKILETLEKEQNYRRFIPQKHQGLWIATQKSWLFNCASNDYLNLACDEELKSEFLSSRLYRENLYLSASSSRSLSGNFLIFGEFEEFLEQTFKSYNAPQNLLPKKALLFNSGYHANVGILSSLAGLKNTLFVADKSIHASCLDGLRSFKKVAFKRYNHKDMRHLEAILSESKNYENIVVLSEGLFSIEGDFAPLKALVALKQKYENIYLYLDEAHSIGSFGDKGLGLSVELGLLGEIDFLVLTFGKALGSVGACVLCGEKYREFFINHSRSLIYSTALPPLNVALSFFNFQKLANLKTRRNHLKNLSYNFKKSLKEALDYEVLGDYNIISLVLKTNHKALFFQQSLAQKGFFSPAIKSPTTPKNKACLRFSLTSAMPKEKLQELVSVLKEIESEYLSQHQQS